jgi:acyl-CoA synthetase (AMP-forming)/AMP-acid ligase II
LVDDDSGVRMIPAGESVLALLEAADANAPAVVLPEGGALTFSAVQESAAAFAASLRVRGVEAGSRVAIAEPDGPAFLRALLGVLAAGSAAAPLNPAYTEEEFRFYLEDLSPSVLLLPDDGVAAARSAAAALGVEVGRIGALGTEGGSATASIEAPDPDGIALLLHTSGTTSRPKQVPLLHRNLVASARTIAAFYGLRADDVSYCAMPLFHVHGLVASVLAALAASGSVVVPRRFTPAGLLDDLDRRGVTWVSAGPTTYSMALERSVRSGAPVSAPSLRFLRSCSSALPAALMERVEERFGVPLVEAYGMTEASHQMASNPLPPGERKAGSVGISTGTEIGIVGLGGAFLGAGAQGEVCVRGHGLTPGYLGNPDANAQSFFDGWFRTGDLGSLDADGYLRLEGRIKEMVIRGGENISPYEVEAVLLAHPAVREAACFGVPDEKYGEEVAAVVSLERPAEVEELLAHCRERLAAFKAPKRLYVADAIPKTATGKVQRQRLPDLLGLR